MCVDLCERVDGRFTNLDLTLLMSYLCHFQRKQNLLVSYVPRWNSSLTSFLK